MNTPNFIKGLQFLEDLRFKWRVQPDPDRTQELLGPQNVPLFLTGKVAMHAVGGEILGRQIPLRKMRNQEISVKEYADRATAIIDRDLVPKK